DVYYTDVPVLAYIQTRIDKDSLSTDVQDALKNLNGASARHGYAILDGLVLLNDNGKVNPRQSGYAKWVIDKLEGKAQGQVVNHAEFVDNVYTSQRTEDIKQTKEFKVDPELFAVVLAALVKNGDIVIAIDGKTYDAMNFEKLVSLSLNDFINFSHIKK